jgi:hypothetical protein
VAERLAKHKIPRRWYFVEEFPLTPSGKILRPNYATEPSTTPACRLDEHTVSLPLIGVETTVWRLHRGFSKTCFETEQQAKPRKSLVAVRDELRPEVLAGKASWP